MLRIVKLVIFTWILVFNISLSYANTFNFKPVGSLPTSIPAGQTVSAIYNITSAGTFPPGQYHILYSQLTNPFNFTQDLTVARACGIYPINPSGCILKLNIIGPVSGPIKVCDDLNGRPGLNCYIPANPSDFLNVKASLTPFLIVSPSTTFLGPGVSQIFTVVNTSNSTAAKNVTITIPSNVQAQLAGPPVYSGCASIAPLSSCTITITASATPNPQSGIASVQGTNTAAPSPTVTITTSAAPALTVSPPTTFLGPNTSQQFTVVNTGTTTTAVNVSMTIPANILAQLTGPPVYSGCASIAPLASCTITITTSASPSAQSGTASVQGTNTAAPAPTVTITTGPAPALTVSPGSTILGPNGSQQFIVKNTSTFTSAINVTMTIPANVQAQLLGAPVYTGCALIAPLGTCTVTITASASPSAQSGTATVQGTNTAAPAPTVSITTGAAPALTVSPPSTVLGPNDTQQFIVTNTNNSITAQNVTITIPPNVQGQLTGLPIYSGCTAIAPLGTCTIAITASASPSAQSGTATVQGTNTAAPAPTVSITTGAAPALTVSPTSTILGPDNSQQFIVTNTSNSITAQNVTMTIPANVQGQLTGLPVYSGCASIAPLDTCTITITASAAPSAQSGMATVQGTNTAAPAPTVSITTGAAPTLTVSPASTTLGPNGSQLFTVTNTSNSIAAQNVTMTIPANVQGQLTGLPVYSGCSLISPLGSCTITITAVASPNAQSGTAIVQGTNTAAPSPTVSITTGAAPTLTVMPNSANISPNGTQIFTVTNTGSITANNITMTIPANVQAQLVGLPIYSGCASLVPSSNACTITIQTMPAPSSQSGIATVQGTNTAAPSPVVNIFILPTCTVLGSTTVTNTGNSVVTGAVCVAPGTAITGFPPGQTIPAGQLHSNDAIAAADHSDAVNLYNSIAGLTCDTPLSADLGGVTLTPGVYCFNAAATLVAGGTLTLNGTASDKWYIQIGNTLTTGANSNVVLTGGALPGNVFWQIGTSATFGALTAFQGQVIASTSLTVGAGSSNNGRLWVVNAAITMDTNNISP